MSQACARLGLFLLLTSLTAMSQNSANADQGGRVTRNLALSTALSFRTSAIVAPAMILKHLVKLPGDRKPKSGQLSGAAQTEQRLSLWSMFFRDSMVKVGLLNSPTPVVLYYHPLADIAILSVWENKQNRRFDLLSFRALPGEHLMRPRPKDFAATPAWRRGASSKSPIDSLVRITKDRLAAFSASYPLSGTTRITPAPANRPERVAAQEMAELRLLFQAQSLVANLNSTVTEDLANLMKALGTNRPEAILPGGTFVPHDLGRKLADLDPRLARQIELSALYREGPGNYLAFLSRPQIGHWYLVAMFVGQDGSQDRRKLLTALDLRPFRHD